ncbi:hypothetical protein [Flexibacterium corallicola]|uniref:hypothetical protein n=1 Tax=Flexibacterium corallicola TaxID=3037259 RepID=UPI00286F2075|nr:hypothetical protein [Pseudovibrio sp. M1P-2-3]
MMLTCTGSSADQLESQLVDMAVLKKAVWVNISTQSDGDDDPENSDVRWAWVDFLWDSAKPNCTLSLPEYGSVVSAQPISGVLKIAGGSEAGAFTINNGRYQITFSNHSLFPSRIGLIDLDGAAVTATNEGSDFYLIDDFFCDGTEGVSCTAHPTGSVIWTIERESSLRYVIKGEASYIAEEQDGLKEVAKAVVRYTILKDTSYFDIEHQVVSTRQAVKYTGLGLEIKPVDDVDVWAVSEEEVGKAGSFNEDGSIYTLKLWEPTALYAHIDYKPETVFGVMSDAYKDALQWMIETHASAKETVAKEVDRLEKVSNPWGVGRTHKIRLAMALGSQVGNKEQLSGTLIQPYLARADEKYITHLDDAVFPKMAYMGEGGTAALDENSGETSEALSFSDLEALHSQWFKDYMAQARWVPLEGWYNYGRAPYNRYMKDPEPNSDGSHTLYPQWYRQSISPYNIVRNSIYSWVRSGERSYMDFARKVNRFVRDFHYVHDGGDDWSCENDAGATFAGEYCAGKITGQYVSGADDWYPIYWAKAGVPIIQQVNDGEDLTAISLEYFLFDDLASYDVITRYNGALVRAFCGARPSENKQCAYDVQMNKTEKLQKVKQDLFGVTPFPSMSAMLATYKVTEDEKLGIWLGDILPLFFNSGDQLGLDDDYWNQAPSNCYITATYKLDRKLSDFLDIYRYLKADRYPEMDLEYVLEKMAMVYPLPHLDVAFKQGVFTSQSMAPIFYGEAYRKTCNGNSLPNNSLQNLRWNLKMAAALHRDSKSWREDLDGANPYKNPMPSMPTAQSWAGNFGFTSQYLIDNHAEAKDITKDFALMHIEPSRNTYMLYALPVGMGHLLSDENYCH